MEDEYEIEKSYSVTEFVAELRRLADALEQKASFTVDMYGDDIRVPEDAFASIAYEIEDGFAELELQLTWSVGGEAGEDDESDDDAEEGDEDNEEDGADDADKEKEPTA